MGTEPLGMLYQRKGHLPTGPGPASPGWGQSQVWGQEGASPSVSLYDADLGAGRPQGVLRRLFSGILTIGQELPPSEWTTTRRARTSAFRNSAPAAAFFQSYAHAGTGRATSPAKAGGQALMPPKAVTKNWNPNMQGAAELHPATTYDPYPSPASYYPKVV